MVKRKLKQVSDWLFLSRAGNIFLTLAMLAFTTGVFIGITLIVSTYEDAKAKQEYRHKVIEHKKLEINEPLLMAGSGLMLIGVGAINRKEIKG